MDHLEIFTPPFGDPRPTLLALRDMAIRVVIAPDGLQLISCKRVSAPVGSSHVFEAAFRPRDELGRFVGYWLLPIEFDCDLIDIEEAFFWGNHLADGPHAD